MLPNTKFSRAMNARIALGLAVAASAMTLSFSARAGEGADDDKSLYWKIDPIVTNLAPAGHGTPLAQAVKLIAPYAPGIPEPRALTPEELAAQAERQVEQVEANRGVALPLQPAAQASDAQAQAASAIDEASGDDDGAPHYARIALTLRFPTAKAKEEAKPYLPEIKNRLILFLSSRETAQMRTAQQKEAFSNAATRLLQAPDAKDQPPRELSAVYITDMIIQ